MRQRADVVNSQFVTDAELNDFINDSNAELWDLLVTTYGENYYQKIGSDGNGSTFNTVNGTATYALNGTVCTANDFYKLAGLDVQQGAVWVPLRRFTNQERTRNQNTNWVIPTFGNVRYRLMGTQLEFIPTPSGVFTLRPRYVPTATILVGDSDTFDSINAWHEYSVCDAAAKVLEKMQLDSSPLVQRKMAMIKRIQDSAPNRDQGEPNRVTDISGLMDNYVDDYFDLWR